MYQALFLSMQILNSAAPGSAQTLAAVDVRPPVVISNDARSQTAVHNPLRKAPRIAGQAPPARPQVATAGETRP